ncbi:hypothetical protein [Nocardioides jensenii]|nr:hypothetical protein [Nocardioides jensenii]
MATRPVSRQMGCPACPHEHHLLRCDMNDCDCHDVPLPGIYPEETS